MTAGAIQLVRLASGARKCCVGRLVSSVNPGRPLHSRGSAAKAGNGGAQPKSESQGSPAGDDGGGDADRGA